MSDQRPILTRRAFLSRLALGGTAAAAVSTGAFKLERLLWTPEAPTSPDLPVYDLTALQELTKYVLKAIEGHLTDWPTTDFSRQRKASKIGHSILMPDGTAVTLTNQYNVAFAQEIQDAESRERLYRSADTVAASFSSRIQQRGLDVFASLELPGPTTSVECVTMRSPRLSLRAVRYYEFGYGESRVRFDILGGVSPAGEGRARRYRQKVLATTIRRRLDRPHHMINLPS